MLSQRIPLTSTKSESSALRQKYYRLLCQAKPKLETQPNSLFDIVKSAPVKQKGQFSCLFIASNVNSICFVSTIII
ncbi:hypothetical protein NPIL_581681, partial [Nephila pilipes]